MINPFAKSEKEEIKEQQQIEANYQLSAATLSTPQAQMDEKAAIDRREVLVQLSQWQQDRSPAMQKLFLKLCGYQLSKDNKQLLRIKWDMSYVSLMGAQKLVNFIEPLDHNVMLGNWSEKELTITLRDAIAHPLREFMFMNHDALSLDLHHATYILWLVINTVEPTYRRGWNDGERRKDREIIKINELRNPYYVQKKKGIFGMES